MYVSEFVHFAICIHSILIDHTNILCLCLSMHFFLSIYYSVLCFVSNFVKIQFIDSSESLMLDRNCDEQLANFVLLNTTDDLQQEITDRFCALNSSEFIAFMKIIMPELSIGDLVQQVNILHYVLCSIYLK